MSSSLQEIPLDKKVGPGTQKENKKVYAHVCVCVCACVHSRERESERESGNQVCMSSRDKLSQLQH